MRNNTYQIKVPNRTGIRFFSGCHSSLKGFDIFRKEACSLRFPYGPIGLSALSGAMCAILLLELNAKFKRIILVQYQADKTHIMNKGQQQDDKYILATKPQFYARLYDKLLLRPNWPLTNRQDPLYQMETQFLKLSARVASTLGTNKKFTLSSLEFKKIFKKARRKYKGSLTVIKSNFNNNIDTQLKQMIKPLRLISYPTMLI